MANHKGERRNLNEASIVRAAIELMDDTGLVGLTTRRLAVRLGVRSPTLYWHVRNKGELLDLVAESICADAFEIDTTLPWTDQLREGMRQFRALLLAHPAATELLRSRPPTGPHRLGHIETTLRILLDAGFSEEDAAGISRMLLAQVLSSVEHEAGGGDVTSASIAGGAAAVASFPNVQRVSPHFQRLTGDGLFGLGIDIIIAGLQRRLEERGTCR